MEIYKLTDFGSQNMIIDSRAEMAAKRNMKMVTREWMRRIDYMRDSYFQFESPYGFNEDKFIQFYGLKGIQFGNWVDYSERADRFLTLTVGLYDLTKVFNSIHKVGKDSNIGAFGQIGIAIGARGHRGALAHFEPKTQMINLTKMNGEHSFAHEYGHAIDYVAGAYFSKNKDCYSLSDAHSLKMNEGSAKSGEMRNLINIIICGVKSGVRYPELKKWCAENGTTSYWLNNTEIFARVFSQWIALKLAELKINDTFLSPIIDREIITDIPVAELKQLDKYLTAFTKLWVRFLMGELKADPKPTTKNPYLNFQPVQTVTRKQASNKNQSEKSSCVKQPKAAVCRSGQCKSKSKK